MKPRSTEISFDPRDPEPSLYHNFVSAMYMLRVKLGFERKNPASPVSLEDCQSSLAQAIAALTETINALKTGKLDHTDVVTEERLISFVGFLQTFADRRTKLTLDEAASIQRQFNETFPRRKEKL